MKKRSVVKQALSLILAFVLVLGGLPAVSASAASIKISKESATITSGKTLQLKVTSGGKTVRASWGSSDPSVASVNSSGLVTAKAAGSAVISAMANGTTVECLVSVLKKTKSTTYRYNVLILDASGSMKGAPSRKQKEAAKQFCKKVLSTSGKNYVAVLSLASSIKTRCSFTSSYSKAAKAIDKIPASGNTNINGALAKAGELLAGKKAPSGSKIMKNIILCSDGLPTTGTSVNAGRYKKADHKRYKYGNAAYNTATKLKKKGNFIYALGFFHSLKGNDLKYGKRLMKDLASKDKYYVIQNPSDISGALNSIADSITKTTLSKTAITLTVGETYTLKAYVNGTAKKGTWKSSSPGVASVNSSGKVTAKKVGKTTVTATVNGKKLTCKVTVVSKLTLNKSKATLAVGEKLLLKATGKGITGKIKWKSSNPSVASVSANGTVTAKKKGKTVISASANGKTAKCTVTVVNATHPLYSVYFKIPATKYSGSGKKIDESGQRIEMNKDAVIEKSAVYLKKRGSYWYVTIAFKGKNVTYAKLVTYLAYKGKVVHDSSTYRYLNSFPMKKGSDGIWSMRGTYDEVKKNITDTNGKIIANVATGKQSENMKMFTDLKKMKEWLKK